MAPKHYRPAGKKKQGNAAKFVTRSQAQKQLQVNLPTFRRLCILKGVTPREPKKKIKGKHHTYYHLKDVNFVQYDPLLEQFRRISAYEKKIKKAEGKKNKDLATRLLKRKPTYTLDRLIRERYPKFVDAIRDLDDCLTMVHLFAALPALEREKIEVKRVHNCRRLSHEWQAYISRTHKLRKVFVTVKGIYYQAEVEGQKITWLAPHAIQQVVPDDVDYGVMLTFLEFYETLLGFVNFRLYNSINASYPPILDPRLEALAADLYALSRYLSTGGKAPTAEPNSAVASISEQSDPQKSEKDESDLRLAQLQHQLNEPGALMHLVEDATVDNEEDEETKQCKKLFMNMRFFLSREVPRESLLFVIPAFGGVVSWEGNGAPLEESDQSITHQIVDKPTQGHKFLSREYVQPQWIFDCINARIILPTEEYLVGREKLPPHLSPFVDNEEAGYTPDYAETIKRLQAAYRNEVLPLPGVGRKDFEDPQHLLAEGVIDRAEAIEAAEKKQKMMELEKQYHDELKMELKGTKSASVTIQDDAEVAETTDKDNTRSASQVAEDMDSLDKTLMSRKKRKLYDAITMGKAKKDDGVKRLMERKKKLKAGETSASK